MGLGRLGIAKGAGIAVNTSYGEPILDKAKAFNGTVLNTVVAIGAVVELDSAAILGAIQIEVHVLLKVAVGEGHATHQEQNALLAAS